MTPLMDSFWIGLVIGCCFGFFFGLLLAGLLRHASDLELRMAHHVREADEHEDITKR